ncbi:MAG: hypothetical protein U0X91_22845 [Spirosomataceae bacterium]
MQQSHEEYEEIAGNNSQYSSILEKIDKLSESNHLIIEKFEQYMISNKKQMEGILSQLKNLSMTMSYLDDINRKIEKLLR